MPTPFEHASTRHSKMARQDGQYWGKAGCKGVTLGGCGLLWFAGGLWVEVEFARAR